MSHMDKDKRELLEQLSELAAKAGVVALVMRVEHGQYAIALQRDHIEGLGYDMDDPADEARGRLSVLDDVIVGAIETSVELSEEFPEIDPATLCNCQKCVSERRGVVH